MAMNLRIRTIITDVDDLCLLSNHLPICILYCASVHEGLRSTFVLCYLLFSSHNISIFVLDYFSLSFDLLVAFKFIPLNGLDQFLLFMDLYSVLLVYDFSHFGLGFDYISFCILHDVPFNYLGLPVFFNDIFFVFEDGSVLASLNFNCILLLPDENAVDVDNLVRFHHGDLAFLLDDFRFVFMHVAIVLAFNFNDVGLNPNDLSSWVFDGVPIDKCGLAFLLDQLLLMGVSVSKFVNRDLPSPIDQGLPLPFNLHSLRSLFDNFDFPRLFDVILIELEHFAF